MAKLQVDLAGDVIHLGLDGQFPEGGVGPPALAV
jgi:hypothetical protein